MKSQGMYSKVWIIRHDCLKWLSPYENQFPNDDTSGTSVGERLQRRAFCQACPGTGGGTSPVVARTEQPCLDFWLRAVGSRPRPQRVARRGGRTVLCHRFQRCAAVLLVQRGFRDLEQCYWADSRNELGPVPAGLLRQHGCALFSPLGRATAVFPRCQS